MPGTLVVGDLLDAARDEHPTFDDRRHPDPVLIRALSRYRKKLYARIIQLDPTQGVVFFDQAMPLANFDAGIAVPAYKYPFGVQATYTGDTRPRPIDLISWEDHADHHHAAYLLNGILFLTGSDRNWNLVSNIRFLYVAELADLAMDPTSVLAEMPDGAEVTLVSFLAKTMAVRGGGDPKPDPGSFGGEWKEAEEAFLDEIARNTQALVSQVRDRS